MLLAAAVGGLWCFSGQLCCSTAHGNDGGDLDGFRNETIEMMDNPMRAASVGRGGAAEEARYSGYEPPVMDQNASAGGKSSSTIIYAVPAEEPEDGVSAVARVPNTNGIDYASALTYTPTHARASEQRSSLMDASQL